MLTSPKRRATDISEFSSISFLADGGGMGAMTRSFDWLGSALGAPENWPELLKVSLRLVLNSKHPMFVFWGPNHIQFYNDAYRSTMGPERHPSALGQPARECWGEIWDIIGPQIESVMAGGPATWLEDQLVPITRNGRLENVWWDYGYSPIQASGGVGGVLLICNDVTDKHLARDELIKLNQQLKAEMQSRKDAENRLPALFMQAPGFMAILRGPEHIFEFANGAYERLVGDRKLIGLTVRQAFPEIDGQGFYELLDEVYVTGKAYVADNVPVRLLRPGDAEMTQCYLDMVYQPMLGGDGVVTGIFVEGYDVTTRHLAQQALEVSEHRMQEGLEAARMTVWDIDIASGSLKFSDNAITVFGETWLTTTEAWKHVHPEDLERLHEARRRAIEKCGTYEVVVRVTRPTDGMVVWLQVSGKVVCDSNGTPVSIRGFTLDLTALKYAEEALKAADKRKDEFLAVLAHELRNPLAPIVSGAQMLKRLGQNEPRIVRVSEIVSRQAEHMTHLINDLLDVSRITSGLISINSVALDINNVLIESIEQVMPLIKTRNHSFSFNEIHPPAEVLGDNTRLVQIVTNLLQNAAKFTPEAGIITLSARLTDANVVIEVTDNGVGIEGSDLPRIFEFFIQSTRAADRLHGGLGIGLALVKNLVELHRGKITASSSGLGLGSQFTVSIPSFRNGG